MTQFIPPVSQGGSGITYSDDGTGTRDMLAGGHRTWFLTMLNEVIALGNDAKASATAAASSTATNDTSSSNITPGTGSKTFTVTAGKGFQVGQWLMIADGTTPSSKYMIGPVTSYSSTSLVVDVQQATGAAGTNWKISITPVQPVDKLTYTSKTAAYSIVAADRGAVFRFSGGASVTFDLPAVSGLTAGWYCMVHNATTAYNVTLDPSSTEQIDAATTVVMYPGEMRLVLFDGSSAFRSFVLKPFLSIVTTTGAGSWTAVPPGYSAFGFAAGGGGGGGGGGHTAASASGRGGGGGAGGAWIERIVPAADVTAISWSVAAAGSAGSATNAGGAGGNSFAAWNADNGKIYAYGGGGGYKGAAHASANSGAGGGGGGVWGAGTTASDGNGAAGGNPIGGVVAAGVAGPSTFGGGSGGDASYDTAHSTVGYSVHGGGGGGGSSSFPGAYDGGGSVYGGGGGGGGGSSDGTGRAGGQGGTAYQTAGGQSSGTPSAGEGGQGGAGAASGTATAGTAGGAPCGAGGGGGASYNGTGGAGGAGARGEVRIWGVV